MTKNTNCKKCGWLGYTQEKRIGGKIYFHCSCPKLNWDINVDPLSRCGYCEHWKRQTSEQKELFIKLGVRK